MRENIFMMSNLITFLPVSFKNNKLPEYEQACYNSFTTNYVCLPIKMTEKRTQSFLIRLHRWRIQRISNQNFIVILAVLVGIISGLAAALLKGITHWIASTLQNDIQWDYKFYLYSFFPLIGIFLSVLFVRRFVRGKQMDHGMTPIIYAISRKSSKIKSHHIYSQIATSALTVGFGGSAGLEAPIAFSGSAIGSNIGRFFGLNYREVTLLLACGAAAGIAGVFNSPVAGIVFAIEILLAEFSIPAFIPLLMAAATASVVSRLSYSEPLFHLVTDEWVVPALLFYILLAISVGLFSVYFAKISIWYKTWISKIHHVYKKVWISGLMLGILILIFPALYGEGYMGIQQLLNGEDQSLLSNSLFDKHKDSGIIVLSYTLVTVFAKSFASLITLNSGGNGGIFGPSLVMGGLLGFAFAYGINLTGIAALNIPNFIVAGMAASLAGIMHAPLTGIFLIAEITGGYTLMVPLMLVTAISYFINRSVMKHSIYTKVLAEQGDWLSYEDKDRKVLTLMKLSHVIEKNFTVLDLQDTADKRRLDIIRSKRNIFPVTDVNNRLLGIIYSERLFEILMGEEQADRYKPMRDLLQKPVDTVRSDTKMEEVMTKMNKEDIWILPVVDSEGVYLGFISKSSIFNKYRSLLIRQATYMD